MWFMWWGGGLDVWVNGWVYMDVFHLMDDHIHFLWSQPVKMHWMWKSSILYVNASCGGYYETLSQSHEKHHFYDVWKLKIVQIWLGHWRRVQHDKRPNHWWREAAARGFTCEGKHLRPGSKSAKEEMGEDPFNYTQLSQWLVTSWAQ